MKPRERVLAALKFQPTDRVPLDLMEGAVWPELMEHFTQTYGLQTAESVQDFLQADFRWAGLRYAGPSQAPKDVPANKEKPKLYSSQVLGGPLRYAETVLAGSALVGTRGFCRGAATMAGPRPRLRS